MVSEQVSHFTGWKHIYLYRICVVAYRNESAELIARPSHFVRTVRHNSSGSTGATNITGLVLVILLKACAYYDIRLALFCTRHRNTSVFFFFFLLIHTLASVSSLNNNIISFLANKKFTQKSHQQFPHDSRRRRRRLKFFSFRIKQYYYRRPRLSKIMIMFQCRFSLTSASLHQKSNARKM